jgi:hypothetical protein
MQQWREKLDEFLAFNDRNVLPGAGSVSRENADRLAHGEYEAFHATRLAEVDAEAERDTMRRLAQLAKPLPQEKQLVGRPATKKPKGKKL